MQAAVHPLAPEKEFPTAERCFITEVANNPDNPAISMARARVEPGVTTTRHKLRNTTEHYIIVSGEGLAEIEGLNSVSVGPGDVVCIPPDTPQRITNTGKDDLIFFAVCSPRFTPECYVSLE